VTSTKDAVEDVLISSTASMPDDPFAPEPLTTECVLSSNAISYSLKSLVDTGAAGSDRADCL